MTFLLNFIKIYQLVPKLMGRGRQAHRQDGDLISLHFSFGKESWLKVASAGAEYDCFFAT